MKSLYDSVSEDCSKIVTQSYSTSFSLATKMLDPSIRNHIYNIYGFVRFADEIVDTFHDLDKEKVLDEFERDTYNAIKDQIVVRALDFVQVMGKEEPVKVFELISEIGQETDPEEKI